MRVRGERTGKFIEHGGLFRSWRFIGLIVTRAKRARRRPRKLLPRKNIFTRETERSPSGVRTRGRRKRVDTGRDRDVDGCGQDVEKSTDESWPRRDLWIIARALEIYRTNRTREAAEERSPSKAKLHARRKHVSMREE